MLLAWYVSFHAEKGRESDHPDFAFQRRSASQIVIAGEIVENCVEGDFLGESCLGHSVRFGLVDRIGRIVAQRHLCHNSGIL